VKKILIFALIIIALAWFFFSGGESDDEYFNNYFQNMVKAGEEKDVDKFMDNFSIQYHDDYGLNYIVLKKIVKNVFEKYENIDGEISELGSSITKDEDGTETAVVNMDVRATADNNSIQTGILGLNDTPENITVYLEKTTFGSWQIVSVEGIENGEY